MSDRIVVKEEWAGRPKTSLVFCETAFINRIGIGSRKSTLRYVKRQIEVIEIVIESFWSLYVHCMGDDAWFASAVRRIGGPHAVADERQVICSTSKGDMMRYKPYGLKFIALRVSLRSVSTLKALADALCMSRRRALIYLLSAAHYAVKMPIFEATYSDVYRAVYASSARPVRDAAANLSRNSQLSGQS